MEDSGEKRIKKIVSSWFFNEPLFYSVYLTHHLLRNDSMNCVFRSGKGRIEYCVPLLQKLNDEQTAEYLKLELYRILLMHPYSRQIYNCFKKILRLASDITIYSLIYQEEYIKTSQKFELKLDGVEFFKNQAVRFSTLTHPMGIELSGSEEEKFFLRNLQIHHKTGNLMLCDKLSFEQWYKQILYLISKTCFDTENGEKAASSSFLTQDENGEGELWEENEEMQQLLASQINRAEIDEGWGQLGGSAQRKIRESADFSFDYRRALSKFRQNIVSANRSLTRMRPSRRYGFKAMGSRYERKANILIGVDVSGSITDESFEHFYKAINNFFFLGLIERIDLIFFDVNLKNTKPITFKKKISLEQIKGRGGTSFQPPVNFFNEHRDFYSGMIIFTDGEGEVPVVGNNKNILWILDSRQNWQNNAPWITKTIGCMATFLPF